MDTRSTNYSILHAPRDRDEERRIGARRADDALRNADAAPGGVVVGFREAKARAIADFETTYLRSLLLRAKGNVSLAARLAGKERSRFNRLIRKHRIVARDFRPEPAREAVASDGTASSC
jgi:transcriptional regulator of acetoin/glycerol metabolism